MKSFVPLLADALEGQGWGMDVQEAMLNLNMPDGPLTLHVPELEVLWRRGIACKDGSGGIVIPLCAARRVTTSGFEMAVDNLPQERAAALACADAQKLAPLEYVDVEKANLDHAPCEPLTRDVCLHVRAFGRGVAVAAPASADRGSGRSS